MKKQLLLALLIASGCSTKVKTEKTIVHQLRTHKEAIDTLRSQQAQDMPAKPLQAKGLSAEEKQELLTNHDLSLLWLANSNEDTEAAVYNGFYGEDHHRIEMYFASIEKDTLQNNLFYVRGKSQFKENITPFEGQIVIDSIAFFEDPNLDVSAMKDLGFLSAYTSAGRFELREDSTYKGSGVFSGKMTMDFGIREDDVVDLWYFSETKGQGSGFLFDGEWKSYKTGKIKPILWAKDIFMMADDILENFSIGERDVEINPKYRHLGWDNFWSNEEWWNETEPSI